MDPKTLSSVVTGGGFVGLLAFVIVAGQQGYWVYGSVLSDVKADRDEWKKLALSATRLGEQVAPVRIIGAKPEEPKGNSLDDVRKRVYDLERQVELRNSLPLP